MKKFSIQLIALFFISFIAISCNKTTENANEDAKKEGSHPKLILTKEGVDNIRKNLGNVPIFDKTLAKS